MKKIEIIKLFLTTICCLTLGASPSYPIKQCVDSLPDDSYSFGSAIATYDKYLVVGDPAANYVVVYTHNRDGKWLRTREILPPKNSTAYKVGSGFGNTLAMDGNNLIIGTFTVIDTENNENEMINLKDFRENNGIFSTSTALYQTKIDGETEVKRIDLPNISTKGVLPTGKVVAENGKIGFIFSQEQPHSKRIKRINQVYVLSNGKAHALPSGKLSYRFPSRAWSASIYGTDIALENNLLLASVDGDKGRRGVWLFDLNSPHSKPKKLTIPFAAPAMTSVAISERFIAISNTLTSFYRYSSKASKKTLIKNIATGSTQIIDGVGGFSLNGNILARTRPISNNRDAPRVLEVFRLDDDATPNLIKKRRDVESALVQNRLLITVQKTVSSKRICTEQVR